MSKKLLMLFSTLFMKKFFQIPIIMVVLMTLTFTAFADFQLDYIEAEGIIYPEKGTSLNQMRRMAIMDAYRYLAEEVNNLYVTSESTVKNMRELDDKVNTKVEATLHGAKIISINRERDGSVHAKVRLPLSGGSQSIAAAVLNENIIIEDFPKPKFTNIYSETHYTGLIIDCKGLNISQAVAPSIKSVDGLEVYAYKNLGYQTVVDKGMVEYSSSTNSTRAGSSPLIVKAIKISNNCDVVISNEDANKILAANDLAKFLNNCLVVLMR